MTTTGVFDLIRKTVDLQRVIESYIGHPLRNRRCACPIHGGEGPNFGITPDGDHFNCWSCGANGDVVDFVEMMERCTRAEAVAILSPAGSHPRRPGHRPRPVGTTVPERGPAVARPPAWSDPAWQAAVDRVVCEAETRLWSRAGHGALEWLRGRGLDDATIRRFRLGFNPADFNTEPIEVLGVDGRGRPRGLWARRGVTIPWVHPNSWYSTADDAFGDPGPRWVGANVRRLTHDFTGHGQSKYWAFLGSDRGHCYPRAEATAPGEPALVCEGEFDSLVGWQEAGHVLNVVTFGGAGQKRETDDARAFLAACPDWLLMFHQDDAGDGAARDVARRSPRRCKRLIFPPGTNDLNDLHRDGGSVLGWLRDEYARFGWPWPLRSNPDRR